MPLLMRKLNYRNILLNSKMSGESVGVLRRHGEFFYVTWLGFIEAGDALKLPEARPVKLQIAAYALEDDIPAVWKNLSDGEMIQGCYIGRGVYGVICHGIPRVVTRSVRS